MMFKKPGWFEHLKWAFFFTTMKDASHLSKDILPPGAKLQALAVGESKQKVCIPHEHELASHSIQKQRLRPRFQHEFHAKRPNFLSIQRGLPVSLISGRIMTNLGMHKQTRPLAKTVECPALFKKLI